MHTNIFDYDLCYSNPSVLFKKKRGEKCTITSYEENGYRRAVIFGSTGDVGGLQALASLFLGVIG